MIREVFALDVRDAKGGRWSDEYLLERALCWIERHAYEQPVTIELVAHALTESGYQLGERAA